MSKKRVRRTKTDDNSIIRLNSIGLSLNTIGEILDVHPTTVSNRLKVLNIEPTYKTHAFMEEVLADLPQEVSDWLLTKCSRIHPIREFVSELLLAKYNEENIHDEWN